MEKEKRDGKWAVVEYYWPQENAMFSESYHFFHTEKEAESYKVRSEGAWADINREFPFTEGRTFVVKFLPCKGDWEKDECSRPSSEQIAKLTSINK
jgi:hypothetical protein